MSIRERIYTKDEHELQPHRFQPVKVSMTTEGISSPMYGEYGNQTQFRAVLSVGTTFYANKAQYPRALKNAQDMLLEEMFKDCKKWLCHARNEVFNGSEEGIMFALDQLQKEMFG